MCGILFCENSSINQEQFEKALGKLAFRGPDARGIARYDNVWLGHTRLKIQDLDNQSNQPFVSECDRYSLIFNGEIYNFKELKQTFDLRTRTTSDTEVLLLLYERLGAKMLSYLNGMFAFVIYDRVKKRLFVARDRLGIKPLFYAQCASGLIFSSEPSAILALGQVSETYDPIGLRQYRKLRTFFNGHTLYNDIKCFPAAHYYESSQFIEYWTLPDEQQSPPSDEELRYLIESSVKYRCIADVPVGSFLSGGLDSTIIAGLANKVQTYTAGLNQNNEFEWSQLAAEFQRSSLACVEVKDEEFVPLWQQMVNVRKEPLSVPNEVLIFAMSKLLKNDITVVLSGEGADELMFGYDRIFKWAIENEWDLQQFDKHYSYGTHQDDEIIDYAMQPFAKYKCNIDRIAAFFQTAHLHGLLRRLDFATMLCGVEARVPFVDHRLVERMAGVSHSYRISEGEAKAPLKRIFSDVVPKAIIKRKKVGFPVKLQNVMEIGQDVEPMDCWLQRNLEMLEKTSEKRS